MLNQTMIEMPVRRQPVAGKLASHDAVTEPRTNGQPLDRPSDLGQRSLRQGIHRALKVRALARQHVSGLFHEMRVGSSIDAKQVKSLIADMIGTINEDPTVLLWASQLNMKHEYTMQHCINVCVLSLAFAHHLGYRDDRLKSIGLGALLHDVGKVRTPHKILDKPGRLSAEEYDVIKAHPTDGYAVVRESCDGEISDDVLKIIRHHHERIDGLGYPDGLKGKEIPVPVLVVAIADAYDAMTTARSYQRALPSDQALATLYRDAERTFSKRLVAEFIRCIGIYPVGSLVELSNRSLAVVLTNDHAQQVRPLVMLIREPNGKMCSPRRHVSLADVPNARDWSIRRIVAPEQYGLDLQAILAHEVFNAGTTVLL